MHEISEDSQCAQSYLQIERMFPILKPEIDSLINKELNYIFTY